MFYSHFHVYEVRDFFLSHASELITYYFYVVEAELLAQFLVVLLSPDISEYLYTSD